MASPPASPTRPILRRSRRVPTRRPTAEDDSMENVRPREPASESPVRSRVQFVIPNDASRSSPSPTRTLRRMPHVQFREESRTRRPRLSLSTADAKDQAAAKDAALLKAHDCNNGDWLTKIKSPVPLDAVDREAVDLQEVGYLVACEHIGSPVDYDAYIKTDDRDEEDVDEVKDVARSRAATKPSNGETKEGPYVHRLLNAFRTSGHSESLNDMIAAGATEDEEDFFGQDNSFHGRQISSPGLPPRKTSNDSEIEDLQLSRESTPELTNQLTSEGSSDPDSPVDGYALSAPVVWQRGRSPTRHLRSVRKPNDGPRFGEESRVRRF